MKSSNFNLQNLSRRGFVSGSLTAAATLVLAGCGSSSSESASTEAATTSGEKTSLTFCLDYTPNTNHTGVYVAKSLGYFDEEGLDVEIVQPADGTAEGAIGTGQAQFGISYQDYIASAYDAGNTGLTAVAAVIQHNTSGIMSRAEDNITRAKEMEGHVYTTWDLDVEQATIKQIMETDGGDYSKLTMVPYTTDDDVAGLKTNMYDCVWVYEGWAVQNANIQDYAVNYFSFKDMDSVFDFYTPVIAANIEWAEANPETAKAFMRAVKKGYEYAVTNPEESAQILCEEVPELSSDLVTASAQFLAGEYTSDAESWGVIDADRWSAYYQWLNDNSLLENQIDVNAGYDTSYLA
jgi:ABC-type nitrate/sulfonate/bicarbonate transport system substrate-binding protein